jgi:predicted metal-dependent hydrolase
MEKPVIGELIRSRRKSIALMIDENERLIVKAPHNLPLRTINAFVESKGDWILRKQALVRQRKAAHPRKGFQPGEGFLFLGETYPLAWDKDAGKTGITDGRLCVPAADALSAQKAILRWYRAEAKRVITTRAAQLAGAYRIACGTPKITSARRRWGSCGSSGTLSFTWRLVMAPPDVIDYVVIHELAHIAVHNHSKAFWQRVGGMMPGYPAKRKWLRQNQGILDCI